MRSYIFHSVQNTTACKTRVVNGRSSEEHLFLQFSYTVTDGGYTQQRVSDCHSLHSGGNCKQSVFAKMYVICVSLG